MSFTEICEKNGFGDLKSLDRRHDSAIKRQAVWTLMRERGETLEEIGRQSNRSHSTVLPGIRRFKGLLEYNDKHAVEIGKKLAE